MSRSATVTTLAVCIISVILGALWFFGNTFEAPQQEEGATNEETNLGLPDGWGVYIADAFTIAYPGAPWTLAEPNEDTLITLNRGTTSSISMKVLSPTVSFEEAVGEDAFNDSEGDMSAFDMLIVGGRTWYVAQTELSDGRSERIYYFKRSDKEIVRFMLQEADISEWEDPTFRPGNTQDARTLEDMLTFIGM